MKRGNDSSFNWLGRLRDPQNMGEEIRLFCLIKIKGVSIYGQYLRAY